MNTQMKRIVIRSPIKNHNYLDVVIRFDKSLFEALLPRFPDVKLRRFDGSKKGDKVVLHFYIGIKVATWVSEITDDWAENDTAGFIDIGIKLPFPLKYWKHRHVVENATGGCVIVDEIEFSTGRAWLNALMLPLLKSQFAKRTSLYQHYFNEIQ